MLWFKMGTKRSLFTKISWKNTELILERKHLGKGTKYWVYRLKIEKGNMKFYISHQIWNKISFRCFSPPNMRFEKGTNADKLMAFKKRKRRIWDIFFPQLKYWNIEAEIFMYAQKDEAIKIWDLSKCVCILLTYGEATLGKSDPFYLNDCRRLILLACARW